MYHVRFAPPIVSVSKLVPPSCGATIYPTTDTAAVSVVAVLPRDRLKVA
jgi:hypothetical protein